MTQAFIAWIVAECATASEVLIMNPKLRVGAVVLYIASRAVIWLDVNGIFVTAPVDMFRTVHQPVALVEL